MRQMLYGRCTNPSGTQYQSIMGPSGSGSEANTRVPWAVEGTFNSMVVQLSAAPGVGKSRTLTLRVEGVSTAVTVTISDLNTIGVVSGVSVDVFDDNKLAMEHMDAGSPTAASIVWALEFRSARPRQSGYSFAHGGSNSSPALIWTGLFMNANAGPEEVDPVRCHNIVSAPGRITGIRGLCSASAGFGNGFVAYINRNGTRQDGSGGTVNTACDMALGFATGSNNFDLPVVAGDIWYVEWEVVGSFTTRNWALGIIFEATTDGESQMCGYANTCLNSIVQYTPTNAALDGWSIVNNELENSVIVHGVVPISIGRYRLLLDAAPGAGNSYVHDILVNGVAPTNTLAITIADSAVDGSDLTHAVALVQGDLFGIRLTPDSLPTAGRASWGLVQMTSVAPAPKQFSGIYTPGPFGISDPTPGRDKVWDRSGGTPIMKSMRIPTPIGRTYFVGDEDKTRKG